jgi:hypothetical protein
LETKKSYVGVRELDAEHAFGVGDHLVGKWLLNLEMDAWVPERSRVREFLERGPDR